MHDEITMIFTPPARALRPNSISFCVALLENFREDFSVPAMNRGPKMASRREGEKRETKSRERRLNRNYRLRHMRGILRTSSILPFDDLHETTNHVSTYI